MIWPKALRLLALSGLALVLAACGGNPAREKNDSSLGLDEQDSPGDLYVAMAAEYYRLGQMDAALRRAQQAIDEDGKNPRAHYMIAVIYQQIGEIGRADSHFKRAVELSPNNPEVHNAYGTFHCNQRRFAEADQEFQKAYENPLYNTPWVAMTNAGTCAASAGNTGKAEGFYRKALTANPRFGPALFKMAELEYRRGDAKVAKEYLDRFFQASAATPAALILGVRTERKLGNRDAAATYEQVLRRNFPDSPEILEL